ncbi:MAG: Hpt domain-containing protein [Candidatus Kapabacteria bacterium]|nr:Hpt domain-containing protein [Candidatus Kapabacteria bacterium]MDW8011654.1 Hpt domain-containing protein [Bacteroidota bacterium]
MRLPDDPLLRELLPEFVDTWQHEAPLILEAAHKQNDAELYRLGHTLKGSCLQFGLTELAELGIQVMECARNHSWNAVPALYEQIVLHLQQLQRLVGHSQGEQ